jgi:GPH family glycoside/pentoside/hexuronide:cation symporter
VSEHTAPAVASLSASAPDLTARLSTRVCIGWGLGTVSVVTVLTAGNTILLAYLTDVIGIAPAIASAIIAASKIYDAVADPVMGVISDRTHTRIGRRRPYLLLGGVLLALSMLALFTDPGIASMPLRTAYFAAILFFWATAYTVFNVPYLSMPAEMTARYQERAYLMSFRVYGVGAAQVIAATFGTGLVARYGGGAEGHAKMAMTLAPIVLAAALACYSLTHDAPFSLAGRAHNLGFLRQARLLLENRPFCRLLAMKFMTLMALGTQSAQAYLFTKILRRDYSDLSVYFFLYSAGMMVSQPFWLWVSRISGKRNALIAALALGLPISLSWFFSDAAEPAILAHVRGLIFGLSAGGMILLGQAMLPDTMEYDARRTGLRREGLYAGLYTTVEKLSGAVGIALIGALLSALGYVPALGTAQSQSANTAIYIGVALIPFVINIIAIGVMLGYDLDEQKLKAVTPAAA